MHEVAIVTDTYTGQIRAYGVGKVPKDILYLVNYGSRFVLEVVPATMVIGYVITNILN